MTAEETKNSNCEEWILLQSTVEPICVSFLIVPIAFGRIMSDWWKCNPTSSWFDRKEDYGFGVNLSLPLMVIIDDFPLSFLDKKAIINISIWGFHTSAVSCVFLFPYLQLISYSLLAHFVFLCWNKYCFSGAWNNVWISRQKNHCEIAFHICQSYQNI